MWDHINIVYNRRYIRCVLSACQNGKMCQFTDTWWSFSLKCATFFTLKKYEHFFFWTSWKFPLWHATASATGGDCQTSKRCIFSACNNRIGMERYKNIDFWHPTCQLRHAENITFSHYSPRENCCGSSNFQQHSANEYKWRAAAFWTVYATIQVWRGEKHRF